jgi:hypothetical protein
MRRFGSILLCLLLLGAAACSRPASEEQYVFDDGSGMFLFEVDMSDSLCVYDLSFYTRLESRFAPPGFPIRVYMTSPSGVTYSESLFYDASVALVVPYRTDLQPVEYGLWHLSVRARAEGLKGMGLICTRKDFAAE